MIQVNICESNSLNLIGFVCLFMEDALTPSSSFLKLEKDFI